MPSTKKEEYKYKFSFVIPIYNVEKYLKDAVESILAQTMSFKDNCQIIFINDGSPDNSEEICLSYQKQFPKNIKYIKQKNAGLSAARNAGIDVAEGKYINFLDPDDTLSKGALDEVYEFFEKNYKKIDSVYIQIQMFEAKTGGHGLNYRFDSSRVIDVNKDHTEIQLHSASSFIKKKALDKGYRFDPRIRKFAEDIKFNTQLIGDKGAYGIVKNAIYWYRKRFDEGSIMDSQKTSREWFMEIPVLVHQSLLDYSRKKLGYIHKYVQYAVTHDIQWRLRETDTPVLSEHEIKQYKNTIFNILSQIDDDVILEQRSMLPEFKVFALSKKHPIDLPDKAVLRDKKFFYHDLEVYDLAKSQSPIQIELVEFKKDKVKFEGFYNGLMFKNSKLRFKSGAEWFDVKTIKRPLRYKYFFDELVFTRSCFKVELPLYVGSSIGAYRVDGELRQKLSLLARRQSGFSYNSNYSYRSAFDKLIILKRSNIYVRPKNVKEIFAVEVRRQLEIIRDSGLRPALLRIAGITYKKFGASNKQIWLISDRPNAAGDNGEAFFKYAVKQNNRYIKPYFVISKKSADYNRINSLGKVAKYGSLRYKLMFLAADKVISSQADDFIINPFGLAVRNYNDIFSNDFVFLQHGITINDISSWVNKYNKNIKLFVTAAKPEYDSIIKGNYSYDKSEVKLTGFPRFDLLYSQPINKLILAPTWRFWLTDTVDAKLGHRRYEAGFKDTEYYKHYQSLINDKRINDALSSHGMTGEMYLHPSFAAQVKDFKAGKHFKVKGFPYDYRTAFSEGSMLVTDYSSVFFDFAYLKKPVIYTQFDHDEFWSKHPWSHGYFSYEKDGFGPVVYSYEDTIKEIIDMIDNNCTLLPKFKKRIDNFFAFDDKLNSKRVYESILSIES